jgi:ATP phosphoribosyltransferase
MAADPGARTRRKRFRRLPASRDARRRRDWACAISAPGRARDLANRWAVVRLLDASLHYAEDLGRTGASTATITRIAQWLKHGEGGYRRLERTRTAGRAGAARDAVRSRAAVLPLTAPYPSAPSDDRAAAPAIPSGPARGTEHRPAARRRDAVRRARSTARRPRQNLELDILFIRATDIIEFVEDGVDNTWGSPAWTCWPRQIRPASHPELDYGHCRLAVAVPVTSSHTTVADLAGLRVATSHPNAARSYFAGIGVAVDVIPLSGAVEVAPNLGLADAIVDLVSTGSTLAMNGLRPIADVLASQAILVAQPASATQRSAEIAAVDTMPASVIAARGRT